MESFYHHWLYIIRHDQIGSEIKNDETLTSIIKITKQSSIKGTPSLTCLLDYGHTNKALYKIIHYITVLDITMV